MLLFIQHIATEDFFLPGEKLFSNFIASSTFFPFTSRLPGKTFLTYLLLLYGTYYDVYISYNFFEPFNTHTKVVVKKKLPTTWWHLPY